MNISLIIEELQRILSQQGDVNGAVKIQLGSSHVLGNIIDIRFRSTGIGQPFVQIIAQEK